MTDEKREPSFMEYMQAAAKEAEARQKAKVAEEAVAEAVADTEPEFTEELAADTAEAVADTVPEFTEELAADTAEAAIDRMAETGEDLVEDIVPEVVENVDFDDPLEAPLKEEPKPSYYFDLTSSIGQASSATAMAAGPVQETPGTVGGYVYGNQGTGPSGSVGPAVGTGPGVHASAGANAMGTVPVAPAPGTVPKAAPVPKAAKKEKSPGYITKKGLIAALLCAMLATSGLTIGGLKLAGAFDKEPAYTPPATTQPAVTTTDDNSSSQAAQSNSPTNYGLAQATGSPLTIQEIISKNGDAVVEITTEGVRTDSWLQNYVTQGAGSGVFISEDGYILTCNHVIEGAKAITVTLKNGNEYPAEIVGVDPLTDVAVIKVEGTGFSAATYGDSSSLSIGDLVVAIGNPLGELGGSASTGIISALDRDLNVDGRKMTLLQTDSSINPGNSGGGLFDGNGNLIGVVVAKSSGSDIEGLGFAIPINTAADIASKLIENGVIQGSALIGVNIVDLTDSAEAMKYGMRLTGIYISGVSSEEALAAGFETGDMIYYVGDDEIDSEAALRSALAKYEPGDRVTVTVIRNNRTVEIETVLIERE